MIYRIEQYMNGEEIDTFILTLEQHISNHIYYCDVLMSKTFSLKDLNDLQFRMCRGILFQILGPEY